MMRVPPSSSGWVVSAAGGIVQRGQCTTNVVHIAEIDLVYYSSDTEPKQRLVGRSGMRWLMEFSNERRGMLARYVIEAPLPAAAAVLGRPAVLAGYPSPPRNGRLSLFERAARIGGPAASGWVLHWILTEAQPGLPDGVPGR